jgi:hypothetical protein
MHYAKLADLQDYAMKVSWNLHWQGRETGMYTKQLPIFGNWL